MPFLYRFRFEVQGRHTHVRVFAGKGSRSIGKCGDLVFRNEEWDEFVGLVKKINEGSASTIIKFVPEERAME